jgi:hypothetical protein
MLEKLANELTADLCARSDPEPAKPMRLEDHE